MPFLGQGSCSLKQLLEIDGQGLSRQQNSGNALCSLATPSGHLGGSLLCTKGNTCENSQGWAGRWTLEENPDYFRSNVAHAIWEEDKSRPEEGLCTSIALNAIVSLGSPNPSLPYLVTMETGTAC